MSITRLVLGPRGEARQSPLVDTGIQNSERYFSDFEAYLVGLLGFAQMAEAANKGQANPYRDQDTVLIASKQAASHWFWRPEPTIRFLMIGISPSEIFLKKIPAQQPEPTAVIPLGVMSALMHNFGQALATNYFERNRLLIENHCGKKPSGWPPVWNFGRVVRNAMSHGGKIYFDPQSIATVSWKGLSYSPQNNGRIILHTDLWPGDIFDLIQDMDAAIL